MNECTQKAAQNVKRGEVYGFRFFLSIGFDQIDMYECGMYDAQCLGAMIWCQVCVQEWRIARRHTMSRD